MEVFHVDDDSSLMAVETMRQYETDFFYMAIVIYVTVQEGIMIMWKVFMLMMTAALWLLRL